MENKKKQNKNVKWGLVSRKNTLPIVRPVHEKTLPAIIKPCKNKP